ncbi:MAG: HAD hydrolase family protein [Candidatus Omnitrophica bacterium]|nr:HAD hydrolase family protein [Candidatus Omnitrophota bacterium]
MKLLDRLRKIKVIAMDVDGVMTDGRIVYDGAGRELKFFDVQDGYALSRARHNGLRTAVISARGCRAVKARMADLKIDKVYLDAYPKIGAYRKMLVAFGVKDEEVCFIGDDLPDFEILSQVGLAAAPANAATEIRRLSHLVSVRQGGRGAVRDIVEKILRAQGKWGVK